jgi:hypothetical protein
MVWDFSGMLIFLQDETIFCLPATFLDFSYHKMTESNPSPGFSIVSIFAAQFAA